jgi:hypothetical protein
MSLFCRCYACGREVETGPDRCPHCDASFGVPKCPHCGDPVHQTNDPRDHFNRPAWNTGWKGKCRGCGHEFAAESTVRTGHDPRPGSGTGHSQIRIAGGESLHEHLDSWDFQPTIEIVVRRDEAGIGGPIESQLSEESRIVLTPAEYREIVRQLEGPLQVLLRRQPWWRDTT